MAPIDSFKQTHVPKQGFKEVPKKVNETLYCEDEALTKQPDVSHGYRHQVSWSQQTNEIQCRGNDRTFDKIVAGAKARENAELERERKLQDYYAQPQRGTIRGAGKLQEGGNNSSAIKETKAANQGLSSRSNQVQAKQPASQNNQQRSVSQLDTIETVSCPPSSIVNSTLMGCVERQQANYARDREPHFEHRGHH